MNASEVRVQADRIEADLRGVGTPERAEKERQYLKSDLEFVGATLPQIHAVARAFLADRPTLDHDDLVAVVEALWAEPVHERRMTAVDLLEMRADPLLTPDDLALVERLLLDSRTWALVDGLAANVAGPIVDRYPAAGDATLDRWAVHPDFWLRRSALLALLVPLRHGDGDFVRFGRYADAMLDETEFFIRKAIGWVLRDTAKRRPDLVFEWLLPRARRASGVTYREAVKPLSAEQRAALDAARGTSGKRRSPPR